MLSSSCLIISFVLQFTYFSQFIIQVFHSQFVLNPISPLKPDGFGQLNDLELPPFPNEWIAFCYDKDILHIFNKSNKFVSFTFKFPLKWNGFWIISFIFYLFRDHRSTPVEIGAYGEKNILVLRFDVLTPPLPTKYFVRRLFHRAFISRLSNWAYHPGEIWPIKPPTPNMLT